MKKILFVDDEQDILDALQDSLRRQSRYWEMTFVCGGKEAISELSGSVFDVVVSDIRMPGVDGIEVLQYAKDHCPEVVRIALTGYSTNESTIRLTSLAQRYLTKPCNVDELEEAILRDSGLIEAFDNPAVKELAGSAGLLPGANGKQQALFELLNDSDASINEISSIVEQDLALTAKLLQLANSSFFRRQASVDSVKQAVSHLGFDILRCLVLANQLAEMTQDLPKTDLFSAEDVHEHGRLTSLIAEGIMRDSELSTTAYTAGLLHDVGKIVIALRKPEVIEKLVDTNTNFPYSWVRPAVEREILGCTHAEIGGYFLNLWGIPTAVVEAVTFHDNPASVHSQELDAVGAVHAANYLAHWALQTDDNPAVEAKLDREYFVRLGVQDMELQWKELASEISGTGRYAGKSEAMPIDKAS